MERYLIDALKCVLACHSSLFADEFSSLYANWLKPAPISMNELA